MFEELDRIETDKGRYVALLPIYDDAAEQLQDDGDIIFEDAKTGLGTPVLVAKAADGSFGAIYTIYMSHEIEVDIFPGTGAEAVTDEDVNTVLAFLTDIDFVPAESGKLIRMKKEEPRGSSFSVFFTKL